MKIASKIIVWILSLVLLFILVNLGIGLYKYKSISDYANFLNQKCWQTSISQISIKNPISIFSFFHGDNDIVDINNYSKETEITDIDQNIVVIPVEESPEIDVYDPEFEDEFNDFFGTTQLEEDLDASEEETGFIQPDMELGDDSHKNTGSVSQQLIEKFSQ